MKKISLLEKFFWNMVDGKNVKSPLTSTVLWLLYILSKIYSYIIVKTFQKRLSNIYDPLLPVISVGNITLGGTGKTPLIISLSEFFRGRGKNIGIVSRGYGRKSKENIILSAEEKDPEIAGDEPLLIKKRVPEIIMCVSSSRIEGIKMLKEAGADIILMDDGFQHPEIKKTMDIVVLDPSKPLGNRMVIPRGNLREDISALKRGSHFVFCKGEPNRCSIDEIEAITGEKPFVFYYDIKSLYSHDESSDKPLTDLKNKRVLALSGIGQPSSFYKTLKNNDLSFYSLSFPDHHNFGQTDYEEINNEINKHNIQAIITTEKDLQRLNTDKISSRIYILRMELRLSEYFLEQLVQVVAK